MMESKKLAILLINIDMDYLPSYLENCDSEYISVFANIDSLIALNDLLNKQFDNIFFLITEKILFYSMVDKEYREEFKKIIWIISRSKYNLIFVSKKNSEGTFQIVNDKYCVYEHEAILWKCYRERIVTAKEFGEIYNNRFEDIEISKEFANRYLSSVVSDITKLNAISYCNLIDITLAINRLFMDTRTDTKIIINNYGQLFLGSNITFVCEVAEQEKLNIEQQAHWEEIKALLGKIIANQTVNKQEVQPVIECYNKLKSFTDTVTVGSTLYSCVNVILEQLNKLM